MQANGPLDSAAIQVHIVALPLTAWGLVRLLQDEAPAMQVASQASTVAECLATLQPGSGAPRTRDLGGNARTVDVGKAIAEAVATA